MSQRYEIGSVNDFPIGQHRIVEIKTRKIGIFNIDGELHALPNICPHQIGPLCEGKTSGTLKMDKESWKLQWSEEGQIVTCPWHGMEFRVKTGECLAYSKIKLRTYKVICENDRVLLEV
ncbi:Rieske (2Fe-2S) protein [Priestia megaterium]|uniref:Rieske (2Fe-2S) protein n=1 Tax=Priestia megaterium TaxID=1404 RepID=UPI002E1F7A32|nr:Rieske (2Fe-2S) protein [Priestia megaterium]